MMTANTQIIDITTQLPLVEPQESSKTAKIAASPFIWRAPESLPARPWVYGHQLLRETVSLIVGMSGSGKSALMSGTVLALATGKPLLGSKVHGGPKRVWLWNLEDSQDELSRGILATAKHYGITEADIAERLFVDSGLTGSALKIVKVRNGSKPEIDRDVLDGLVAEIIERQIDVLIIDPLVSCHDANENDNMAMDMVGKAWASIAAKTNCSVVLVHHSGKGKNEVDADAARGASSLVAAARSVLTLNKMTTSEASQLGIEAEDRHRYFKLYDHKNNRAPPAKDSGWMRMESVFLDNGADGGDSIGVVVPVQLQSQQIPEVSEDVIAEIQQTVQSGAYNRYNQQADGWIGKLVSQKISSSGDTPPSNRSIQRLVDQWISDGIFKKVHKKGPNGKSSPCLEVGTPVGKF